MKTLGMKTKLLTFTVIASLITVGCESQKSDDKPKLPTVKVQANERMDSEDLALAAEQLVSPYTFMLAYKAAKMAYEKDPQNLKAEFYMRLLKRFEAYRGIGSRLRPALNAEQLAKHNKWLNEFPDSPLRKFLEETGKPIKTITDMQDVLSEYYTAVSDFRQFLKRNQSAQIDLYLNPHVFQEEIKREAFSNCEAYEEDGSFEVTCSYKDAAVKRMNTADLIMLRQITSAELLYSFMNSYSLEGIQKLDEVELQQGHALSNKEKAELLTSLPNFGFLRQANVFSVLKEIGSDYSGALKWAMQYQKNLCPQGESTPNQRKGYLFNNGICINSEDSEIQNFIATLDRALGGITQLPVSDNNGNEVQVNMNLFAWSTKPIQDLRQVAPTGWNACDKATSLKDNTLGGLFVDGNVNITMDTTCE